MKEIIYGYLSVKTKTYRNVIKQLTPNKKLQNMKIINGHVHGGKFFAK